MPERAGGATVRRMCGDSAMRVVRGGSRAVIAVLLACAAWLGVAATAQAMPGDPPIEPLTPADGAVLAPNPDGVLMTFTCPAYRFADAGGGLALYAGREYYSLRVTTSPQLDADGRLASAFMVDQATASSDPAAPTGECFSGFSDGSASGVHTKPGTYYWQVARICSACGGYEVGPVRTLRIAVQAAPTVALRWKPWAGYGVVADVKAAGVPEGAAVTVQRRAGGAWSDLASGAVASGAAAIDVVLPKGGATAVRVVIVVGDQRIEGAPTELTVRKPGRARSTSRKDDGVWRGTSSSKAAVTFKVRGAGREIRDLAGKITALCPAAVPGQFIAQLEAFAVPRARIAPDGRFLITVPDGKQRVRVAGRLRGGKVVGGEISWTDGLCTGTGTFAATRR